MDNKNGKLCNTNKIDQTSQRLTCQLSIHACCAITIHIHDCWIPLDSTSKCFTNRCFDTLKESKQIFIVHLVFQYNYNVPLPAIDERLVLFLLMHLVDRIVQKIKYYTTAETKQICLKDCMIFRLDIKQRVSIAHLLYNHHFLFSRVFFFFFF